MTTFTIHKLNSQGEEVWRYTASLLQKTEASLVFEAIFDRPDQVLHGLVLGSGDRFIETHYRQRWFSIFAILDQVSRQLKGWYCNINRPPRIDPPHLYSEDLAMDMLVFPNRRWKVIDEEEFAALDLRMEERRQALQAVAELQSMVIARRGPFSTADQ